MDAGGRPDFGALQNRMHRTGPEVPRMAAAAPVTYLVFDLLRLGRRGPARTCPTPSGASGWTRSGSAGHRWVATPWFRGRRGRRAGRQPGERAGGRRRQAAGLALPAGGAQPRLAQDQELPHPGGRRRRLAAGAGPAGRRRSARCCSASPTTRGGWSTPATSAPGSPTRTWRDLKRMFTARNDVAVRRRLPREVTRDAHWVEPDLVGEVAYAVWTADGRLRHPSWRGVRDDLEPDDVVVEP